MMLGRMHNNIPWHIRIRLWFVKPIYSVDCGFDQPTVIMCKWFKGRCYILQELTAVKSKGECVGSFININHR